MKDKFQHVRLIKGKRLLILTFLLLVTSRFQAQEVMATLNGYLLDERTGSKLKDILIVNKTSGEFSYGDKEGNYSIQAKKKDVLVFSALGYSSVNFSLKDSVFKPVFVVIPKLNKYSIIIQEVNIEAERAVQDITAELDNLSRSYNYYEQTSGSPSGQFSSPISALYSRWSKREESKRKVARLRYLDRKKILLHELIRRSKLSQTELLSEEEQSAFIDHLLKYDFKLVYLSQYELLAYINNECKRWMGAEDSFNVRERSK